MGSLQRSPNPTAGFKGPYTSKRKKGEGERKGAGKWKTRMAPLQIPEYATGTAVSSPSNLRQSSLR